MVIKVFIKRVNIGSSKSCLPDFFLCVLQFFCRYDLIIRQDLGHVLFVYGFFDWLLRVLPICLPAIMGPNPLW